jgi:hypothetical protein
MCHLCTELVLKIEINTREHANLFGLKTYPFELVNGWHESRTDIASFEPEELFGTKLRARAIPAGSTVPGAGRRLQQGSD